MKSRTIAALVTSLTLAITAAVGTAQSGDREAIRQAALDYVEGVYNTQPERIQRSVHPSLVKRGFFKRNGAGPYIEAPMSYQQLVDLAGTWNKDKTRDTSIKKVDVLDALDQTAVAKVTASWGIDYLLLARYDGTWKIGQIVWQSPPPKQ